MRSNSGSRSENSEMSTGVKDGLTRQIRRKLDKKKEKEQREDGEAVLERT